MFLQDVDDEDATQELPLTRVYPIPYASCCRKGKRSALAPFPLTFPIFSSLSTLCKITFTLTLQVLYVARRMYVHAGNNFTPSRSKFSLTTFFSASDVDRLVKSYEKRDIEI